jgi:hypothetical protein
MSVAALLLALAGCGSRGDKTVAQLPPAPLPAYGIGDTYQFDDGSRQTVVATGPDEVLWRGADGSYITSRDVLLPPLAWTNASMKGERHIGAGNVLMFPLQAHSSVAFTATRTVRQLKGRPVETAQEDWRCAVAGEVQVQTKAGRFNTWRIDCSMTQQPGSNSTGVVERSYFYAPEIGFYVRREERVGDGPARVTELTRFTNGEPALPEPALRIRVAGIQQALERDLSGADTAWRDPATGAAGDVRLLRTVRSEQYGWCRTFAETIRTDGRTYNFNGTGCRNKSGNWEILALAPATGGSS